MSSNAVQAPSNPGIGGIPSIELPKLELPVEMPKPEDIELGWTVDHFDEAGIEDLRSRGKRLFDNDQRPVILFDGVCNFCNAYVNHILDLDPD